MTDPKDGGAAFPTNDLTALRAQMKALEGFTPGPWATECDDCHFGSLSSVRGGGAAQKQGLHRELMVEVGGWQGVKAQEATTRLIASAPDMHATILALCDAWDDLRAENERLRGDRDEGAKDYCNLSDQRDALWVENERLRTALTKINVGDGWAAQMARAALAQEGASDGKASS